MLIVVNKNVSGVVLLIRFVGRILLRVSIVVGVEMLIDSVMVLRNFSFFLSCLGVVMLVV